MEAALKRSLRLLAACAVVFAVTATPVLAEEIPNDAIDLAITKVDTQDPVVPGQQYSYVLTGMNNAPFFSALEVFFVDTLPAEVDFVSADAGCTYTAATHTVECDIGRLGAGESAARTITVAVPGDAVAGTVLNEVTIEDRDPFGISDADPSNNRDDEPTTIEVEPEPGAIGDFAWHDIDADGVQDAGETGIDAIEVTVTGPSGTFTATTSGGGLYLVSGLAAGTYTVTVDTGTAPAGFVPTTPTSLTVDLAAGQTYLDVDFGFDDQQSEVLIDLELTKTVDPASVTVGQQTTFTLTLTNQGPDPATGVTVTDVFPTELTYVSHTGTGFDPASGIWTVGDLGVGATTSLTVTVSVDEAGAFTNVAEVTTADQPDVDSVPNDGQGDDYDDAQVTATQVLASGTIGDFVWHDLDADGVQDSGEPGIGGVTVTLTNTATSATTSLVTNASGIYLFVALDAGDYTVAVDTATAPDNMGLTTPGSFSITLPDGGSFLTADFGFTDILPPTGFDSGNVLLVGLVLLILGGCVLATTYRGRRRSTSGTN